MKKDIDTLISEERNEIISKYDKVRMGIFLPNSLRAFNILNGCFDFFQGRQEGVKIDPWEDADYSICKVIDRFGFLQ